MQVKAEKASRISAFVIPILCFVIAAGVLLYSLETYEPHTDAGFGCQLIALIAIVMNAVVAARSRKCNRFLCAPAVVSLVLCLLVFVIADRIPLCPECDHTTAADLGFLTHWISPCYN